MSYITNNLQIYLDAKDYSVGSTNSTWLDKSGNNINATLSNFAYNTTSGWDNGLVFDGIDDTVTIPALTNGNTIGDHTIELYFKMYDNSRSNKFIMCRDKFIIYNNVGGFVYINRYYSGGSLNHYLDLVPNTDYHIICSYKADGSASIYVNGTIDTYPAKANFTGWLPFDIETKIGNTIGGPALTKFYIVREYSYALSSSEMIQNHNSLLSTTPIINLISYTKDTISDKVGMSTCVVTFQSDQDLVQWEARADSAGVGTGDLVGSGGAVTAKSDVLFNVDYNELLWGDKIYKINIYGQNASGEWSSYE